MNDCVPLLPKVFEEIETQTNLYNQELFQKVQSLCKGNQVAEEIL